MAATDPALIEQRYESEPVQEPMHGRPDEIRRNPSTDQKRVRRQIQRSATVPDQDEQTESRQDKIARLLSQASKAPTVAEQRDLVREADELRFQAMAETEAERAVDLSKARVDDQLVPRAAFHSLNTGDTDWIAKIPDVEPLDRTALAHQMVAEASMWFGTRTDDVKAHAEEYFVQARGMGAYLANMAGDDREYAERAFMDEAVRLRALALQRAAFVEVADEPGFDPEGTFVAEAAVEPGEEPIGVGEVLAASALPQVGEEGLPTEQFSSLQPGVTAPDTSSLRAPAIQELTQGDQGFDGASVVPPNPPAVPNEDHARPQPGFPVSGSLQQKESSMANEHFAQCPTCGGQGKVAVRQLDPREAYSGLPQIDQIVDADDSPNPTQLPAEVAFPLEGWGAVIPSAINQAEQQISERNKKSPLLSTQTSLRTEAGPLDRDNSGWLGDMGAGGVGGPGYSDPNYGGGSNLGQPDPVYGFGGDEGNRPLLPHSPGEEDDVTNGAGAQWQPGMPLQDDYGQSTVSPTSNTAQSGVG